MTFDNYAAVTYTVGTLVDVRPDGTKIEPMDNRLKFKVTQQGSFMGSFEIHKEIGQLLANMTDLFVSMHGAGDISMSFSPEGKEKNNGR